MAVLGMNEWTGNNQKSCRPARPATSPYPGSRATDGVRGTPLHVPGTHASHILQGLRSKIIRPRAPRQSTRYPPHGRAASPPSSSTTPASTQSIIPTKAHEPPPARLIHSPSPPSAPTKLLLASFALPLSSPTAAHHRLAPPPTSHRSLPGTEQRRADKKKAGRVQPSWPSFFLPPPTPKPVLLAASVAFLRLSQVHISHNLPAPPPDTLPVSRASPPSAAAHAFASAPFALEPLVPDALHAATPALPVTEAARGPAAAARSQTTSSLHPPVHP
jgi:hypothetical protein